MYCLEENKNELQQGTMRWIKDLAKKERESIGFIPLSYYQTSWMRRRLIVNIENGSPTGFLHWGHLKGSQKSIIHVNQLCVQRDARRFSHASKLMNEVVGMPENMQAHTIWLRCAEELDSNLFWEACGGVLMNKEVTHTYRRRAINMWMIPIVRGCTRKEEGLERRTFEAQV